MRSHWYVHRSVLLITNVLLSLLGIVSPSQAEGPPAVVRITPNLVHIEPGKVPQVMSMTVKIVDPADHFVVDMQTQGEPVQWLPHAATGDGYYRYEVWVTWQDNRTVSIVSRFVTDVSNCRVDNSVIGLIRWRRLSSPSVVENTRHGGFRERIVNEELSACSTPCCKVKPF
ncbi:MAG: hypothetical protein FJ147_01280 [Deltaproteobacteria bacterium]|nr:hypothetical protein [Deltaproteobacteria bacterium]